MQHGSNRSYGSVAFFVQLTGRIALWQTAANVEFTSYIKGSFYFVSVHLSSMKIASGAMLSLGFDFRKVIKEKVSIIEGN